MQANKDSGLNAKIEEQEAVIKYQEKLIQKLKNQTQEGEEDRFARMKS